MIFELLQFSKNKYIRLIELNFYFKRPTLEIFEAKKKKKNMPNLLRLAYKSSDTLGFSNNRFYYIHLVFSSMQQQTLNKCTSIYIGYVGSNRTSFENAMFSSDNAASSK